MRGSRFSYPEKESEILPLLSFSELPIQSAFDFPRLPPSRVVRDGVSFGIVLFFFFLSHAGTSEAGAGSRLWCGSKWPLLFSFLPLYERKKVAFFSPPQGVVGTGVLLDHRR